MSNAPPTRRLGRPRRDEAGDIEKRLMEATVQMLVQHGTGVTMNALIAASGLSRKTVYARYPNMSALLLSVLRKVLDFELAPLAVPDRADWRIALRDFISDLLKEVSEPHAQALRRILMMESSFFAEVKPQMEEVVVKRYIDPINSFFSSLVDRKLIPPQDTHFAAQTLMHIVLMEAHRRFLDGEDAGDRTVFVNNSVRLFCGGLMADSDFLDS